MNIIDYALQMEKDGEAYYRELADQAEDAGIKKVFTILADAEAEHYQAFMKMKENQPIDRDAAHIEKIKTIFTEMKAGGTSAVPKEDQIAAYTKARDVEKESEETYRAKADEISDPEQKQICLQIAEEEAKHYMILDNLIDFLKAPATWVEDAEWRNMTDY